MFKTYRVSTTLVINTANCGGSASERDAEEGRP